ncbi:MAG: hypothetical protein IIT42_02615, partial [Clostridia bacterium]|nr:hypothetical protein [Clostridia bacterium]
MEEQGKMNLQGDAASVDKNTADVPMNGSSEESVKGVNTSDTPPGQRNNAFPQNPANGYSPQYGGYGQSMPAAPQYPPYNNSYNQQYPQQGNFRPVAANAGYPAQGARPYGSFQQNANGTGPGQYNYKASMGQHGQNNSYSGAGPGQYDFRSAAQPNAQAQKPQAVPPQTQYVLFNNYQQQYQFKQNQGANNFGYYGNQQPFGYPGQQPAYGSQMPVQQPYAPPSGNPQAYGPQQSAFNSQMPTQQQYLTYTPQYGYNNAAPNPYGNVTYGQRPTPSGYPNQQPIQPIQMPGQTGAAHQAAPNPSRNPAAANHPQTAEKSLESEPKTTEPKMPDGEIISEEITADGKKRVLVKKVVKKPGEEDGQGEKSGAKAPSQFVQNQIKAELGEDALSGDDKQPVVVYKSKMKKKADDEGVYKPSLRDMFLGPPKKDTSDKQADFFQWKCPDCGTVNDDVVSACKCGCTIQRAKNIAKGRIPKDRRDAGEIRENNPLRPESGTVKPKVQEEPTQAQEDLDFFMPPRNTQQPQVQMQTQTQPQPKAQNAAPTNPVVQQPEPPKEPEVPDDYDPEMPDKVELTEEEIQAEIDEFMRAPVQVWRPKSQLENSKGNQGPTEIYLMGNDKEKEQKEEERKKEEAKKAEEEKSKLESKDAPKTEDKPVEKEIPKPIAKQEEKPKAVPFKSEKTSSEVKEP